MANPANYFKPGHKSTGGHWRTFLPAHLKNILALSKGEMIQIVSKWARMTKEEYEVVLANPKSLPMVELTIATVFYNAAKNGDYRALEFLLTLAVGKLGYEMPEFLKNPGNTESLEEVPTTELLRRLKEKLPGLTG